MARSFGSALLRARRTLTPIETLDVSPVTTLAQAYEAQRALVDDSGASVAGYKIGACSKAAQDSIALSCPIAGHILADAVHARFESRVALPSHSPHSRLVAPPKSP